MLRFKTVVTEETTTARVEGEEEALRGQRTGNGTRLEECSFFLAGFPVCIGMGGPGAAGQEKTRAG